ncbi:uncharacterized protein LOC109703947 isoform X3 [Ananas comosus]|uniref:Uncharacterized protein LOC109703947 isoform X3 n=1 Tax=Ananas comosus TaxID=4615 RepID=A0A6P5EAQ0_ANACO|nr:uncharacterized protein LOC109703947 isoform X3 [Ananas comosus]
MPQQRTLLVFGGRFRRRRRRSSPRETGTFSLLMREGKYVDAGKYVFLLLLQGKCSDILKWRSFYATHDTAWKAHYREDCLEEDEVYSVARLLGDLVAYRASRTGHLELLQVNYLHEVLNF